VSDRVRLHPGALTRARRARSDDDFVAPKYDTDDGSLKTLVLLLSTPRSGSKFVCDQFRLRGGFVTHEYFHPLTCLPLLADRWGALDGGSVSAQGYVDALVRHRTSPAGVLGVNVHGVQLATFSKFLSLLTDAPEVRVVNLQRRDRIAQAISFVVAQQTQEWIKGFESHGTPHYSSRQIDRAIKEIARQKAQIDAFVELHELEPLDLVYEEVAADPAGRLAPVFSGLPLHGTSTASPVVERQSGATNREWHARYRRDVLLPERPRREAVHQTLVNVAEPVRQRLAGPRRRTARALRPVATVASAAGRVVSTLVHDPSRSYVTVRGAGRVAGQLVRDPRQARYLGRWVPTVERTTLDVGLPWLPFEIIDRLDEVLTPTARVFEYGGGGSTLWMAQRAGEVVTVEHDPEWAEVLRTQTADLTNATLLVRSAVDDYADYVPAIDDYPDGYFDLVVVDGRERVRCFARALPKVRPGGLLLLDDTERSRYAPAFDLAEGVRHVTVRGLKPGNSKAAQTTVWFPQGTTTAR
jgi:LPS sulfotransferase NodH